MKHYTPLVTLGLYFALVGIGASFVATPSHNLWSVRYLWQTTAHPLLMLLPANTDGDGVPVAHESGHVWQARALLASGQILQAEALLRPALVAGNYDAQRLQAEILAARGNVAGAVEQWAQVGAVDDILVAAQQAGQAGKQTDALYAYRTAYTLAPERTALPFAQFLRQKTKDVADAENLLRQYIAALPHSPYFVQWLRELGLLYQEQEAWNKALTIYTQLVAALPDSAPDRVQLGWLYYERNKDTEKAMAQFQQAITVAPQEGDGYYAIGMLLSREQQYQEAASWFAQAIEREPQQQWWYLVQADTLEQAGNRQIALKIYEKVQQQFPNFAQGYYQAAWAYRQVEEQDKAVSAIKTAIQLLSSDTINEPEVEASYYTRAGQIYEWTGQLQQAVTFYEQAIQLDPSQPDAQNGLQRLR